MKLKINQTTLAALAGVCIVAQRTVQLPDALEHYAMLEQLKLLNKTCTKKLLAMKDRNLTALIKNRHKRPFKKPKIRTATITITYTYAMMLRHVSNEMDPLSFPLLVKQHVINPVLKSFLEPSTNPTATCG